MISAYIGCSSNYNIRFNAASGGIGTALIKYLFEKQLIDFSVSFDFNPLTLLYVPFVIDSFEKYKNTGSIYQEIDYLKFVKEQLCPIAKNHRVALFCLPCQTKAVRAMFDMYNIESFIIGLTCSSQQSINATKYLLKELNINFDAVKFIQYRGKGWPSGIRIECDSNREYFIPNINSIWSKIFHSRLFIQKKCFVCKNTFNTYSDIVLADPWFGDILKTEKIGKTLIGINTFLGQTIFRKLIDENEIIVSEIDSNLFYYSQIKTVVRKKSYITHASIRKLFVKIVLSEKYHRLVCRNHYFFLIHCRIVRLIESIIKYNE